MLRGVLREHPLQYLQLLLERLEPLLRGECPTNYLLDRLTVGARDPLTALARPDGMLVLGVGPAVTFDLVWFLLDQFLGGLALYEQEEDELRGKTWC